MAVILSCAHCGGALGSGDRFCAQCGAGLLSCSSCGESLLPGDLTCPECGTPAEPGDSALLSPVPLTESQALSTDLIDRLKRATVGEFELGPEIGRGGMAAVFLAQEIALDRKVAIKVLAPGLLLSDGIDRFKNEAVTIANLHHPHIVSLYSVRQAEGLHFFVMRYVHGRSLEQIIQRAGRLPLPVVRSILYQVGSALIHAHRSRVIHRDVKPANILIDEEGNAVVTDFGIAKAAESPTLTLTGALVGTPAYMSPEQCSGTGISWASDQYALGAVAYEMLTGVPPFSGSTLTVMQAHVERTPIPIREHFPDCPADLEAAVFQMLAKDPADRWPRMSEALAALRAAPLSDDDPLRGELSRLATAAGGPAPRTRSLSGGDEASNTPVGAISILPPPAGLEVGDSFVLVAMVRGQHGTRLPPTEVTWRSDQAEVLRFESHGGVAVATGAGSTLLTATCRGVEAHLRVDVAPPRADEIVIGALDHPVGVGDEIRLEAITRDKRGRPIARSVEWQSEDSSTATVTSDGALVALAPGFARITAVLDDARAGIVIPVLPARVAAIQIADWPTSVVIGRSFVVTATPVDSWDNPLVGRTVSWRSSDVSVAVVSAGGWVATLGTGSVVLTATCEDVSASIRVSVQRPEPASVVASDPAPVVSQPRSARRRRLRRSRRTIVAAAVGASLAGGVSWLLGGWPISGDSPTPRRTTSTVAVEPPGYGPYLADHDSLVPAAMVKVQRPARKPQRASASRTPVTVRPNPSPTVADQVANEPARTDVADATPVSPIAAELPMETAAPPPRPKPSGAETAALEQRRLEAQLRKGVEDCYLALRSRNVPRVTEMYRPASKADQEKLRKLSRILRTREWSAVVGKRVDGSRHIGPQSAAMEFSFGLTWKDAFGGHLRSEPVFRAEFARRADQWQMSSCRIVGSPKL